METEEDAFTLTVITVELTQAPTVLVTVYVVVTDGVDTVTELEVVLKFELGDQEYVPAPPLAVKVTLCPEHIDPEGL